MKPLSELVKEIPRAHYTTKLLMEAWLREADELLDKAEKEQSESESHYWPAYDTGLNVARAWIRRDLLGTRDRAT